MTIPLKYKLLNLWYSDWRVGLLWFSFGLSSFALGFALRGLLK